MHIYNVLLNQNFLKCINESLFDINFDTAFDTLFEKDNKPRKNYFLPILNSLKKKNNIFIEIDSVDNKTNDIGSVKILTSKEFLKNFNKIDIVTYKENDKVNIVFNYSTADDNCKDGYLLHFGKNIFVMLNDVKNEKFKSLSMIPIKEYPQYCTQLDENQINYFKKSIIDMFNNQIIENKQYNLKTIFVSDGKEFITGNGKFDIINNEHYTQYEYHYKKYGTESIYNFICLTDGITTSENYNLQNYYTIGLLLKNLPIKEEPITNSISYDLGKLVLNNLEDPNAFIKILGINNLIKDIYKDFDDFDASDYLNYLIENLNSEEEYIKMYQIDLNEINKILKENNNINFLYKENLLFKSNLLSEENKLQKLSVYDNMRLFILTKINEIIINKININNSNIIKETYTSTGKINIDNKIKEIVNNIKNGNICYIMQKNDENKLKINEQKIKLKPNDYIYYAPKTDEIILVNNNNLYIILTINDKEKLIILYLIKSSNLSKESKEDRIIVYNIEYDQEYLKYKNYVNENFINNNSNK